jgi:hypothetical protein
MEDKFIYLPDDLKSNYLIITDIDVKSIGTFSFHEEFVNINLISGYKPISIAGWHSNVSIKIFLYNLIIGDDVGYYIDLGWQTFDGSEVTNNLIVVKVLYVRN